MTKPNLTIEVKFDNLLMDIRDTLKRVAIAGDKKETIDMFTRADAESQYNSLNDFLTKGDI
jgi:hypothetical protein